MTVAESKGRRREGGGRKDGNGCSVLIFAQVGYEGKEKDGSGAILLLLGWGGCEGQAERWPCCSSFCWESGLEEEERAQGASPHPPQKKTLIPDKKTS